jgi:hypothetical protein
MLTKVNIETSCHKELPAVGLDPIGRGLGDRARRRHAYVEPALARRSGQSEAARTRLIHGAHMRPEALKERHHLDRRHPQLAHAQFAAGWLQHRGVRLCRMHVQTV